jgi:hypothetical protein
VLFLHGEILLCQWLDPTALHPECSGALHSQDASTLPNSLLSVRREAGDAPLRGAPFSHTCALPSAPTGPESRLHLDPQFRTILTENLIPPNRFCNNHNSYLRSQSHTNMYINTPHIHYMIKPKLFVYALSAWLFFLNLQYSLKISTKYHHTVQRYNYLLSYFRC